jgi:hypothetical protein
MTQNRYAVEFIDERVFTVSAPNVIAAVVHVAKAERRLMTEVVRVEHAGTIR